MVFRLGLVYPGCGKCEWERQAWLYLQHRDEECWAVGAAGGEKGAASVYLSAGDGVYSRQETQA